ncbi:uncharacterized protein LOC129594177 [Paramacrobiotus metropolitanus]|uniref:uncharacterized protein LOC129594177 n=1 Tax=Paramacrobiotus metropolitanus TaxID=2943436 RepID=UPI002445C980|nr:uncharacterized protein LOC129594177 [Paramacrobiotus metropolitanus]
MAPHLRQRSSTKKTVPTAPRTPTTRHQPKASHKKKQPGTPASHTVPLSKEEKKRRQERLWQVDEETQGMLDEPYKGDQSVKVFRFVPGAPVVSLSKGAYHEATIECYYRTALPESIFPPGQGHTRKTVPVGKWIPTVNVRFFGYSDQHKEEIPENELISRCPTELCFVQGLLYAHEFNTWQRESKGLDEIAYGKTAWFMSDESYEALEKKWQRLTGHNETFAAYCGRFPAVGAGGDGGAVGDGGAGGGDDDMMSDSTGSEVEVLSDMGSSLTDDA